MLAPNGGAAFNPKLIENTTHPRGAPERMRRSLMLTTVVAVMSMASSALADR
jgi:hypothetical protein